MALPTRRRAVPAEFTARARDARAAGDLRDFFRQEGIHRPVFRIVFVAARAQTRQRERSVQRNCYTRG